MKILKRLSLMSTIHHRSSAPKLESTLLQRYMYSQKGQKHINPCQQLIKYGYTHKRLAYKPLRLFTIIASICLGFMIHLYVTNIYKNQIKTRNKYRIQEQEHSSILLRGRRFIFKLAELIQRQLFSVQIIFQNRQKKIEQNSQAILRTQQYLHYMRNKSDKFDFMDIGVMEKYPFPEIGND